MFEHVHHLPGRDDKGDGVDLLQTSTFGSSANELHYDVITIPFEMVVYAF
jgi:hypothetical protein